MQALGERRVLVAVEGLLSSHSHLGRQATARVGTRREGSLGYRDRLPAWRGPGTGLKEEEEEEEEFVFNGYYRGKLCHQGYQRSKRNLVYGIWSQ